MTVEEKQLIEGCLGGDRKAQKALYERYSRKMYALCLRYVRYAEDAQDLLQEGFIKVYTSLERFSDSGSFEGWIRRIFVNCALENLRRKDVLRDAADVNNIEYEDITDDEDDVSPISAEMLTQIIGELPSGFRTVFNMYAVEGYSHREIGEALGIQESSSRSQYMRARLMLQKMIKERINKIDDR